MPYIWIKDEEFGDEYLAWDPGLEDDTELVEDLELMLDGDLEDEE